MGFKIWRPEKPGLFTALKKHIEENSIDSVEFIRSCAEECDNYVSILDIDEKVLGKSTKQIRALIKDLDTQSALPPLLAALPAYGRCGF